MSSSSPREPLQVLISSPSPDFPVYVYTPIVWLQLRHFCDQDSLLKNSVKWHLPIVFTMPSMLKNEVELKNIDVLGLSSFIWSDAFNNLLAKSYRQIRPDGLIVMGGPQVDLNDPNLFEKYPDVGLFVQGEGEIAFAEILKARLNHNNFDSIEGVHRRDFRNPIAFGKRLSSYSSESYYESYSEDLDSLLAKVKKYSDETHGKHVQPLFTSMVESDRGCPYRCQFCSWGGAQGKKLANFDVHRAEKDLEWAIRRKHVVHFVNANLGLYPHDAELFEFAAKMKKKYQSKGWIWSNWAKSDSHVERISSIATKAYHDGLIPAFKLSLQTTDKEALASVGRKNFSDSANLKLIQKLHQNDVVITGELILGLPGDSLKAFTQTVADCLEMGIHSLIMSPYVLLPGSESYTQKYRDKNQVKTLMRPWMHYTDETYEEALNSKIELCVESYSYNKREYVQMNVFAAFVGAFVNRGFGLPLLWFLKHALNIEYKDALEKIFTCIQDQQRFPLWQEAYSKVQLRMQDHLGEKATPVYYREEYFKEEVPLFAEGHFAMTLFLAPDKASKELFKIFESLVPNSLSRFYSDLEIWNRKVHSEFHESSVIREIRSQFDWTGYFKGLAAPKRQPTQRLPNLYKPWRLVNQHAHADWKMESDLSERVKKFSQEFIGNPYMTQPAILSSLRYSQAVGAQSELSILQY